MKNKSSLREGGVDRLSSLPDPILHHILSFLATISAVQTSVLSRRWRFVWRHVHVINIHCKSFEQDEWERFKRFVDMVLSLRYPLSLSKMIFVNKFYEKMREQAPLFRRVISYALSHGTQYLAINEGDKYFRFSNLFGFISDSNLKDLKLTRFVLDVGFRSGFRLLTRLELVKCTVSVDDHDEKVIDLFSQFPNLENLVLRNLVLLDDTYEKVFRISGLELLSLNLDFSEHTIFNIQVYAPKLKSFTLQDFCPLLELSKLTLPSLEYADIQVFFYQCDNDEYVSQYAISLFSGLNNAISLVLRTCLVQELGSIADRLQEQSSPFTRLETLIVEDDHVPLPLINYFLQGSSSLKQIVKLASPRS